LQPSPALSGQGRSDGAACINSHSAVEADVGFDHRPAIAQRTAAETVIAFEFDLGGYFSQRRTYGDQLHTEKQ
jgi:hypothetical protein